MAKGQGRKKPRARSAPGPKRTWAEKALDKVEIAKLMRQGYTQAMIAEHLGVSPITVYKDWRELLAEWNASKRANTEEAVTLKLEEYGRIKMQAWEAWEKSKADAVEQTSKNEDGAMGSKESTSCTIRKQVGDPAFLQKVLECLKAERTLLGLDAPKKVNLSGTVENKFTFDVFANIDPTKPITAEVEDKINAIIKGQLEHKELTGQSNGQSEGQSAKARHKEVIDAEVIDEDAQ